MTKTQKILYGNVPKTLLEFAIPIILGNIFQQLYNIVDAMVVGKFLGDLPLDGISVASPAMDILNAVLIGGSVGIGVLVGHVVGANDLEKLKNVHSTALVGGIGFTLVLSLIGVIFMPMVLRAQGTEEQVCEQAMMYLYIILAGLIFCFLYNYYANILRAYGNSRTPFTVLLCASTIHALLDVVLVGKFNLGIKGVAFSTIFCQFLSSVWMIVYTYKYCEPFRLKKNEFTFNIEMGKLILSYAWAAAMQQAVVCIGRFLVQGMLTGLGTNVVTGYNMGFRIELFIQCVSQGVSGGMIVSIAQNLGNKNCDRVRSFFLAAFKFQVILEIFTAIMLLTSAPQLVGLFSNNAEVIEAGAIYSRTMALIYFFSYMGEIIQGFFRGIGRLRLTMIASLLQIIWRVTMSYLMIPLFGIYGICLAVGTGWMIMVIIEGIYAIKCAKRLTN